MGLKTYRDLEVWKIAMDLTDAVYDVTSELPNKEKFNIISQMERAAVSIPCNIAEGYGRIHRGDYVHHLSMAQGSLREVETLLVLCVRRKYISRDRVKPVWKLAESTGKLLTKLIQSLRD
ncbi:MAG TPA: four helix bundle protein [Candidatus Kapabacteria bacterium]|nr:four helix bundle protein [Candidatus Kapabacteria bacterium]